MSIQNKEICETKERAFEHRTEHYNIGHIGHIRITPQIIFNKKIQINV